MKTTAIILTSIAILSAASPLRVNGQEDSLFREGEFDVSPYVLYSNQSGGKWGAGAALTYYITENIGAGVSSYWTEPGGTIFDNLEAEAYYRLPLPVFDLLAPYAVGGVGRQFDRHYWFETIGVGLNFRLADSFDAFSDVQYRIANSSNSHDGVFLRLGLRLALGGY